MLIGKKIFKLNLNIYRVMKKSQKKLHLKIDYEQLSDVDEIDKENKNNIKPIKNKELKTKSKLEMLKQYESEQSTKDIDEDEDSKLRPNFKRDWDLVQKMRSKIEAPVDTMGAEFCPDTSEERPIFKFQSLISVLLSSQTKDPITYAAMDRLIKHGLTVDNIIDTDEEEVKKIIHGVSFHNNKAKYIKKLAQMLKDDYNGEPPENFDDLMKLPGIGPKMAYIYLHVCCNKIEGIAVDTHVHRICNRLKWVDETKLPEQTRKDLQSWLPKKYWADINILLVGFGQIICKAVAPNCAECLLNKTCDFGIERLKEKSKSKSKSKSPFKVKEEPPKKETKRSLKRKSESVDKSIKNSKRKK
jgi:endonuclease-3